MTVPRPLFVEEYGLKRLMLARGIAVEMSRDTFEDGQWAATILDAFEKGQTKGRKPLGDQKAAETIAEELAKWMSEQLE